MEDEARLEGTMRGPRERGRGCEYVGPAGDRGFVVECGGGAGTEESPATKMTPCGGRRRLLRRERRWWWSIEEPEDELEDDEDPGWERENPGEVWFL